MLIILSIFIIYESVKLIDLESYQKIDAKEDYVFTDLFTTGYFFFSIILLFTNFWYFGLLIFTLRLVMSIEIMKFSQFNAKIIDVNKTIYFDSITSIILILTVLLLAIFKKMGT